MKNRFIRMLSILCTIMLMTGLVSVWASAEETAATPTDLAPSQEEEAAVPEEEETVIPEEKDEEEIETPEDKPQVPETEEDEKEEKPQVPETEEDGKEEEVKEPEPPVDSVEVIITKSVRLGETWEGVTRDTKLTVLKLDLDKAQTIHLIVEGKNAWANIRKSEQSADNLRKVESNPETKRAVINLDAEAGSYLITIGPVEPNKMAKAKATILDDQGYAAWEAALENSAEEETAEEPAEEPADEKKEETEDEPAEEPAADITEEELGEELEEELAEEQKEQGEEEKSESEITKERHITVDVSWDVPDPVIGDTAHLKAVLEGYDDLEYTMQWQCGPDKTTWFDIPGETGPVMDVVVTEENNVFYWRILVYVEEKE